MTKWLVAPEIWCWLGRAVVADRSDYDVEHRVDRRMLARRRASIEAPPLAGTVASPPRGFAPCRTMGIFQLELYLLGDEIATSAAYSRSKR